MYIPRIQQTENACIQDTENRKCIYPGYSTQKMNWMYPGYKKQKMNCIYPGYSKHNVLYVSIEVTSIQWKELT